jgi:hypothetical protein
MRLLLFLFPLLVACSADRKSGTLFGPAEEGILVVDAALIVDQPLPDLFLRHTLAPGRSYSLELAAVTDAEVAIRQGDQTFIYAADPDSAGRYLPPLDAPLVLPRTTYRLEVQTPGGQLHASTTTPQRLELLQAVIMDQEDLTDEHYLRLFSEVGDQAYKVPENQLPYREGLLELRVEPTDAIAYQLAIFNLEADSPFLIDEDFLEEDDFEDFDRQGSSPPLEAPDGRIRLPWFAIAFEGRHLFKVYTVDENWFDYTRTNGEDGGGFGGLIGDNFERPTFNVEGGIGLFGSAAVDSIGFYVLPRPENQSPGEGE